MSRRVVITGIGAVTPLGNTAQESWEKATRGESGITELTRVNKDIFQVKVAGEVKGFEVTDYIDKKEARRMDRFTHYAIAASKMALEDSKLEITDENSSRVGVWIGSGIGGIETYEQQFAIYNEKGPRRISPFFIPMLIPDMASGQVSIMTGAKGINSCTVTACATGTNSIGDAFKAIARGDADAMITGGSEAPLTEMACAGFSAARALSFNPDPNTACRPFDKERDGFIMGEGAGIVVLEELDHALSRGATIYAEVVGYGATGDAYHITAPAPNGEGAARAMRMALEDAKISPSEVNYINAHGTSTEFNDKFETIAIKEVFAEYVSELKVSSTKSMTGHLLGAAGGVEAIFSAMAIKEGIIPPTINQSTPDPECDLNYVPNEAIKQDVDVVMSNSFGFGGHNATLVFKKYK